MECESAAPPIAPYGSTILNISFRPVVDYRGNLATPLLNAGRRSFGYQQPTNADTFVPLNEEKGNQIGVVRYRALYQVHILLPRFFV